MNIYLREMKAHRKSLIIWCIAVSFFTAMAMMKFSAFKDSGDMVNEMMSSMPEAFKAMFGVGVINLTDIKGYYAVCFLYFALMATVHSAMIGANIISKEERDKTVEFLLTKPISRIKIITSKILAAVTNILILNITITIASIVAVKMYDPSKAVSKDIAILMTAMFILQLIFVSIGLGIAAISKNPKRASSMTTGILLFTYIISMAIDMNSKLENIKYITPFKYYDAKNLIFGDGFSLVFNIISIVIICVMIALTYVFYSKRDLNI